MIATSRVARHYDVVVVGGGMVGATLALALVAGDPSLTIALVDASRLPPDWRSGDDVDLRVSAVAPASERVFRRLGVWSQMTGMGVSPFREMEVWDGPGGGRIHFDSAEVGVPYLGHIVENRVVQRALIDALGRRRVDVLCPVRIEGMVFGNGRVRVDLDDGGPLHAELVVGADGGRSRVRELAGIGVRGWSYRQEAIVATVETAGRHLETAWQCFLPGGPLAFLPLADGRSSIVWSTSPREASELAAADNAVFCERLQAASEGRLGAILDVGPRAVFPLRLQQAGHYVEERLALVGDAAHTIHPLAGQGVNLGILDAVALAEVIGGARDAGRDWTSYETLRRYERWRKGDVLFTMGLMEGFKRLFGQVPAPLVRLRSLGLASIDRCEGLKRAILERQLGYGEDLPRLAARAGDLTV